MWREVEEEAQRIQKWYQTEADQQPQPKEDPRREGEPAPTERTRAAP